MTEHAGLKNSDTSHSDLEAGNDGAPSLPEQRSSEINEDHGMFNPRRAGVDGSGPDSLPSLNSFDNPE